MSDAVFQRTPAVRRIGIARQPKRLPAGYGLAIGALMSIGLWGGIFWIAARVLG